MKKTLFLTTAFALILAACGTKTATNNNLASTPPPAAEIPLSFELVKDSLKEKNLTVLVELLVAKGKGSEAINEAINKNLGYYLTMGDEKAANLRNYKDMFAYLQKAQKEAYEGMDMGEMMGWTFEFAMKNHYQSSSYLCFSFDCFTFAGGAHPNGYGGFINIDLNTNKVLANNELVDSAKIMAAVDAAFRQHWKAELKGVSTYEEAGFFIDGNKLPLPANIGISDKKATFYYNPYEIGAYVMGPTVLEIPIEQVAAGLKVK